jgi:hypothetical protein
MTDSKPALPHSPSEFRLKSRKTLRQKLSIEMNFGNKLLANDIFCHFAGSVVAIGHSFALVSIRSAISASC